MNKETSPFLTGKDRMDLVISEIEVANLEHKQFA